MGIEKSAQDIADALAPAPSAPSARWRWGTVKSVSEFGTMNVEVGGFELVGIRAARHCMGASVGDRVRVSYYGTDAVVDAVRATDGPTPTDTGWRTIAGNEPAKGSHQNGMRVRRIGNVVQLDLRAGGGWNAGTIGTTATNLSQTIPVGFRPCSYIQFPGSVPGADIRCYMAVRADNGVPTIWCSSNTFYYTFSTTWLTDDEWPS